MQPAPSFLRCVAIVVVVWHVVVSTNLSGVLSSAFATPVRRDGREEFPCSRHACDCPDAEACRDRCCCFPAREPHCSPAAAKASLVRMRCGGCVPDDSRLSGAPTHWQMLTLPSVPAEDSPEGVASSAVPITPRSIRSSPPEKVPIPALLHGLEPSHV